MELSESPCHCIMPRASGVRVEIANKESLRVHEADEVMQCIRGDLLAHSEKKIAQLWWGPALSAKR